MGQSGPETEAKGWGKSHSNKRVIFPKENLNAVWKESECWSSNKWIPNQVTKGGLDIVVLNIGCC